MHWTLGKGLGSIPCQSYHISFIHVFLDKTPYSHNASTLHTNYSPMLKLCLQKNEVQFRGSNHDVPEPLWKYFFGRFLEFGGGRGWEGGGGGVVACQQQHSMPQKQNHLHLAFKVFFVLCISSTSTLRSKTSLLHQKKSRTPRENAHVHSLQDHANVTQHINL